MDELLRQDIRLMLQYIIKELTDTFNLNEQEAFYLINKYNVRGVFTRSPILIHDSPRSFAVALIANEGYVGGNSDYVKILEKYYRGDK